METIVEERGIIMRLYNQGKSYSDIANTVGRSRSTVQSIVNRFKNKETLINNERSVRPRKLSTREQRYVINIIKKSPRTTSSEIAAQLAEYFNNPVSSRTVRRVLHRFRYRGRVPRKKPYISKINRTKRLQFAKEYVEKDNEFWEKVLFTDESKFNIFRHDGRILVWRKPNTAYNEKNLITTVKHGGGGVMVWGCMAASGIGELVFIEGNMDKFQYLNILKENLKKVPTNWVFQMISTFNKTTIPAHGRSCRSLVTL